MRDAHALPSFDLMFRLSQQSSERAKAVAAAADTIDLSVPTDLRPGENDEIVYAGQLASRRCPMPPGEIALRAAVLERAIYDLDIGSDYAGRAWNVREDALRWITSGNEDDPFSFAAVCQALGLNLDAAREALVSRAQSIGDSRRCRWARKTTTPT